MQTIKRHAVLVTGGGGFLGGVIVDYLKKRRTRVISADRNCKHHRHEEMLCLDLENPTHLKKLDSKGPYSAIIHCAAVLPGNISDQELISSNQRMTYNLAAWAINNKVANFLFASSCSIYGYLSKPCDELSIPQPPNLYAVSKIACEYMINAMAANTDTKVCILRISAPYGPDLVSETVISRFLRQGGGNKPIILLGTGARSQDFVYQDDVADAFYKAISHNAVGTFNISGNQPVSMRKLAEVILGIFGKKRDEGIILKDVDSQEFYRGCFPITSATHSFGFVPEIKLEEGLRRTAREWGLI